MTAGTVTQRLGAADEARAVLEALDAGRVLAVVTLIEGDAAGTRLLLAASGEARGTLGDETLDRAAIDAARAALGNEAHEPETANLQGLRVLLEVHRPAPRLVVVGAGHISVPLVRIALDCGFDVTVLDDREEFADATRFDDGVQVRRIDLTDPFGQVALDARAFVVLVTRAHRHDYDCLRRLLATEPLPRYVGMIGSRRRVRAAFAALLEDGVPRERIERVRAPLGLDIGAETPAEIALSVVAEMIALRRGVLDRDDTGAPLSRREGVLARFFPETP